MQSEFFYHYTTIEGLRGIIENECLWATEIHFLNDPSETYYIESLINQICEKSPTTINIYNYFNNESYKSVFFDSASKYITSMSTERDSLSMWNYYSKGNGYCIKFKKSKLFKKYTSDDLIPDITRKEKLVNYDYDSQIENIKAILNKYMLMIPKSEELKQNLIRCRGQDNEIEFTKYSNLLTDIEISFMDELYANRLLYKHPAYEREHEIRIVSQHEEESVYRKKYRSTDSGQLIEYIELPINLDNIKEIMIHPLISNDVHEIGLKSYLSNQELSYIKVTPSLIPFRNL